MRLDKKTIEIIKNLALSYFGINTKIYIFGSRVNDIEKGGDIDIYIETYLDINSTELFNLESKYWTILQKTLGERKIDIIVNDIKLNKNNYIYEVAKKTGVMI
ncbi:MAG: nucleotidyltransferase domain-containing protein [Candidatus Acididesulfobacter diazotrophicus]|uniref:Nucleotidyltransferase domain-containing protein n=1 Tax=Candidatus Acididesulfobacter diazotrophicus TaxID=2597226 RepID=A0A519BLJ1_9DELT|nr:MAG: nucleotidyltransferase domain-containing protein [Candidatus Acididesulfobacter diazotrophicus]